MKYVITVSGCDDSTSIVMKLTEEQHAFLCDVARRITDKSDYVCMPTMRVEPICESGE